MFYSIRHVTTFHYSEPITESVMEARLNPRTEGRQRCIRFQMVVSPKAHISITRDYLGNIVHCFNVPGLHDRLAITTDSTIEITPIDELPEALSPDAWQVYDALNPADFEFYDMLQPGRYTPFTPKLHGMARELHVIRRDDPLTVLKQVNQALYDAFDYDLDSTDVDTHIDHVLEMRRGVCQDFAHIMIVLVRSLGIPCRYVSGYLFHRENNADRSAEDASHAWVEAWLPELGWLGFDPTNNRLCRDRHIRVAIGRDYADVPPTKGVFRGVAETELKVSVQVRKIDSVPVVEEVIAPPVDFTLIRQQIQIQQQQQQQ